MSCGIGEKNINRISAALILWLTLLIIANLECETSTRACVPYFMTGVAEPEWDIWEVGNRIIIVSHSLVCIGPQ